MINTHPGRSQPCKATAHQDQLGFSVLLSDTSTVGGARDRTSILPVTGQPCDRGEVYSMTVLWYSIVAS